MTMKDRICDTKEFVAVVDRERYVREFRDVATFEACCKACPNYGNRWGCPPFDRDTLQDLEAYEKVMIIGVKLTPHAPKIPMEQVYDLMRPELERLTRRLLEMEREKQGFALGFVCTCERCGDVPCARRDGKPCRHPDVVRPSLEAYGFNVSETASKLLGIDIVWSKGKNVPRYLTLVCALFYNDKKSDV